MLSSALVVGLALLVAADIEPVRVSECPKDALWNGTVRIPHENDCRKYYMCLGHKKVLMECPIMDADGNILYFNPELHLCDWPWSFECDLPLPGTTIGKPSDQIQRKKLHKCTPPTKCPRVDQKTETVHLPHETDCTKFYKCLQGTKILMSCPVEQDGYKLYFNPCKQVCDWPYNVDCYARKDQSTQGSLSFTMDVAYPTKCPKVDPANDSIVLPFPGDCTKFYECSRGKKIPMDCPEYNEYHEKLRFNPKTHRCDWPENVDCIQSELLPKVKISESRSSLPTKCPKYDSVNETVLLPHASDCTKFYVCSHGQKVLKQCPEIDDEGNRLYFNYEEQICDWSWNVDCQLPEPVIRAAPVREEMSPVANECPAVDPVDRTVLLPYEGDCTKFYMCLRGHKYEKQCPKMQNTDERLHFNKYKQTCDWPWTAGCDSDIPTPIPTQPFTTTPRPTRPSTTTPRPTRGPSTTPYPTTPTTNPTPDPDVEGCIGTCPEWDPLIGITTLPHEECRKWCSCESDNRERVWLCPGNTEFSPTFKKCTDPKTAGCHGKRFTPQKSNDHDEALMNVLGYNKRFML